jgi:diaminopimelate decarboxylase
MHPLLNLVKNYDLLEGLAHTYGTPLYLYSRERIQENLMRMDRALNDHFSRYRICYAIKANNNPNLLRTMKTILPSLGGDCSSPGEIQVAKKAGLRPEECIYTGNYESREELKYALSTKCHLNLDDGTSLDRLLDVGIPSEISFRLNPGFGRGSFSQIITAGREAKFGIPRGKILAVYRKAKDAGIEQFGIQCMSGSGVLDEKYFPKLLRTILDITRSIENDLKIKMNYVSMGGGFGIPYRPEEAPLDMQAVCGRLENVFYDVYKPETVPELWVEPGKFLVGDAGILLSRVTGIKTSYKNFIGLDAGMETLMRPALYRAYHRIFKVGTDQESGDTIVDFTGPICENTDRLAVDRPFPAVTTGDLVAIMDVGAYGYTMSHNFNTRPRAAEVLLEKERATLFRRRETIDDLFRLCHG